MPPIPKLAVIGGGAHSRLHHLPALAHHIALHPTSVALAAFCDLSPQTSAEVARDFGFARAYTDIDTMLEAESPDACIAITPIHATFTVAEKILRAGIPLLMEKPPGATREEAEQLCALVAELQSRAMVSMNRRFDPAICAARRWTESHGLSHIRVSQLRNNRREHDFVTETGIHCIDAARSIAGNILNHTARSRKVDGVTWFDVALEFESGATGSLAIMPTCGSVAESYELFAPGSRALARAGLVDDGGFTAWEDGKVVADETPAPDLPPFILSGACNETVEFLEALAENRPPTPTPADVRPSVILCHAILESVS